MVKLVAFDLDGTTLQSDHMTIIPECKEALSRVSQMGIEIVPTTGRLSIEIPPSVLSLPGIRYMVCANGALVYHNDEKKVLFSDAIDPAVCKEIFSVLKSYSVCTYIFSDSRSYMDQKSYTMLQESSEDRSIANLLLRLQTVVNRLEPLIDIEPIYKFNFCIFSEQLMQELWSQFEKLPGIAVTSSLSGNIELNSKQSNKGIGLRKLCEYLKIDPEEVLAFGDGYNDIEMLEFAGIGVAMGNAGDILKQRADYVTDHYLNGGVAKALNRFILHPSIK